MTIKDVTELLEQHKGASIRIMLPDGKFVPDNFHVTEIGQVQKTFIDCGGTSRKNVSCLMQVWTADDEEHRLVSDKLVKIIKLGEKVLESNLLPVEIEYGSFVSSQYSLSKIEKTSSGLIFLLEGKKTDCLAPDKCGVTSKCC